ncbi:GNAT family N-acetyltransferase [Schnuerera ultunensis]|uniref:N-acetyltransferase domain-containing protein n=1 Tax=[Clostridium] ultunense Esp TaxID=1288971 RepID=A0A1M4PMI1_9FIRM|nr:GNAT family protein [Schnuerera ultunensis]SHD76653.1 protein of unknown function [[Clostridium] ultunense Esp]
MIINDIDILLRVMDKRDLPHIKSWYNDYENTRYTSPYAYVQRNDEEEEVWYQRKMADSNSRFFIIEYKNQPAGLISYSSLDLRNRTAMLSIIIGNKKFRRLGIGQKAILKLEKYLKDEYNIRKLSAEIFEENVASLNLFNSLGYKEQGRKIEEVYRCGKYHTIISVCKFFNE